MSALAGVTRPVVAHAHPDDETLATGVLLAWLADTGIPACVLTATRGERGEVRPGVLPPGADREALVSVRMRELACALAALRVAGSALLGTFPARAAPAAPRRYRDSGMAWVSVGVAGPAPDAPPDAFTRAPAAEAAADVLAYLEHVRGDALVTYDASGGYGHPDHVHLHRVCQLAASHAGVPLIEVHPPGRTEPAGIEWLDLAGYRPVAVEALGCYASQLVLDGGDVVHVGGQREPVVTRIGLRRAAG